MNRLLRWIWISLAAILVWHASTAPFEVDPHPLVDLSGGDNPIDSRTALFLILAAVLGGFFVLFVAVFIPKCLIDLLSDTLHASMPPTTVSLIVFILATLPLVFGFFHPAQLKATSVGAYLLCKQVIEIAGAFDPVINIRMPSIDHPEAASRQP